MNPAELLQVELNHAEKSFLLGYCDGPNGELTHFFWASDDEEHGPCYIHMFAYQHHDQLMELLALIKSLGDQIRLFQIVEPPDVQLQDLIRQPFRARMVSEKGPFNTLIRGDGYWQARVCDLAACMAKTYLDGPPARFNLTLRDPHREVPGRRCALARDKRRVRDRARLGIQRRTRRRPRPSHARRLGGCLHPHVARRPPRHRPGRHRRPVRPPRTIVRAGPDPAPARAGYVWLGVLGKRSGKEKSIQDHEDVPGIRRASQIYEGLPETRRASHESVFVNSGEAETPAKFVI